MEEKIICKYCGWELNESFEDCICDSCWEILNRTRYINLEVLNKLLAVNGLTAIKIKN